MPLENTLRLFSSQNREWVELITMKVTLYPRLMCFQYENSYKGLFYTTELMWTCTHTHTPRGSAPDVFPDVTSCCFFFFCPHATVSYFCHILVFSPTLWLVQCEVTGQQREPLLTARVVHTLHVGLSMFNKIK